MRQRHRPSADRTPATDDPVEEGTRVLALLMFAGGFALGLFFGWLLHRERVERALYEDVVRARDRATATLAETSARLELANRDAVRLRGQLTDAQRELADRGTTIARLRSEAETGAAGAEPGGDVESVADGGFEEVDVTEEVVPTGELGRGDGGPDAEAEVIDEAEEELELVDEAGDEPELVNEADAEPALAGEPEAEAGEPEVQVAAVDDTELEVVEEAELEVVDEPAGDELDVDEVDEAELEVADEPADEQLDVASGVEPESALPVDGPEPTEADLLEELAPDEVEDDDELVAAGGWYDREPAPDSDEPVDAPQAEDPTARDSMPSDGRAAAAAAANGIGTPLVLEAEGDATAGPDLSAADVGAEPPAAVEAEPPADDVPADDAPVAAEGPSNGGSAAADDLRRITGVGPALEHALRSEGITTYRELALLDEQAIRELGDRRPRLVNRLRRDDWVAQARRLHQDVHGTPI